MSSSSARSEFPIDAGHEWKRPAIREHALPHSPWVILQELRAHHPAIAALDRVAWAVFLALATFIRNRAHAYPTQATLAHHAGFSDRNARRGLATLKLAGLIVTRRVPGPSGNSSSLLYAFGPAAEAAFAGVAARFPKDTERSDRPGLRRAPPPSTLSGPPPAKVADKPQGIKREPSSCESANETAPSAPPVAEEEASCFAPEDIEIAREVLGLRWTRKHPKKPAPRSWDCDVLTLVATRVAETEGTREEKLAAQAHALAGAWMVSAGAPSVKFIWGGAEHFVEHVSRGEKKAKNDTWRARERATASEGSPPLAGLSFPSRNGCGDRRRARACEHTIAEARVARKRSDAWASRGPPNPAGSRFAPPRGSPQEPAHDDPLSTTQYGIPERSTARRPTLHAS